MIWRVPRVGGFLQRVGVALTAKYVGFECAEGYYTSIDMPTALHPQTIMAVKFADEILPVKYGHPFKVRIPTKVGFKNPKIGDDDFCHQPLPRRVLGGSRL